MSNIYKSVVTGVRAGFALEEDETMPADAELEKMLANESQPFASDRISALERIKQMWDDFDLEEYIRINGAPPVNSDFRQSKAADVPNNSDSPSWRHRVTVPRPFDMTIRDEFMNKRKDEKLEQMRKEKLEHERMMEAQLQSKRQFRANPVPAHVYLPIYDELARSQEQRRQFTIEHSQQLLRSLQKPFKFTIREHASRSLQRCSSATELNQTAQPSVTFKAKPVPPTTNDPTIAEKLRERDLYRKIQARMRAIELYRSAQAPPSMEARRRAQQELLSDTLKKRASSADRNRSKQADPLVYERLSQPAMRPPLPVRSKFIPPDPAIDPYENSPVARKSRPRSAAESMVSARLVLRGDAAPPTKLTATSELRLSLTQQRLAAEKAKMEEERILREKKELRRREMAKVVGERAIKQTPRSEMGYSDKYREGVRELADRDREYRQKLREMEEKVANQPLLAERVTAEQAKKEAAKKYREALRKAGLSEDEILQSTAIAAESYDHKNSKRYSSHERSPYSSQTTRLHLKPDEDFRADFDASPIDRVSPEDDYAY